MMTEHQWQLLSFYRAGNPWVTLHWCNACGAVSKTTHYVQQESTETMIIRTFCPVGGIWSVMEPACREERDNDDQT